MPFLNLGFSCSYLFRLLIAVTILSSLTVSALAATTTEVPQSRDNVDAQAESQLMKQGERSFRRGEMDAAETTFRQVLATNKSNTKARLRLSHVLLKKRILVEAYTHAIEVTEKEKHNDYAFALAGNILLTAGNFNGARQMLIAALKIDRENTLAVFGLGMLDFYENRLENSLNKLDWAAFNEPQEADFILSYAQVAAKLEKFTESAAAYRTFLRIAPIADVDRRDRIRGMINFLEYLGTRNKLYQIDGKNESKIKIEVVNDRPIIKVRAGKNNEELSFVIDTGSNMTVLSEKTAERLGINPVARGGKARGIGGDGKFDIVYGFLSQVTLGDVRVKNVPVYIRDFPQNIRSNDGYIGLAMLSRFLTTIDFGDMSFTMTRTDNVNRIETPAPVKDEVISNLRLTPSGFLSGEVNLAGVDLPLNFIVDTGAELSVISTDLAERDGVKQFVRPQKIRVIGAAGVTEGVSLFHLPSVSVGSHRVEEVRAIALNLSAINENAGFEQSGILGGNFLKHYKLRFDFSNYTLSFIPIKPATIAKE